MQLTIETSRTVRKALRAAFGWGPASRGRGGEPGLPPEGAVVGGTMLGRTIEALEREFTARELARPCHREAVYHVSLAASDGEVLGDADWATIGQLYAERLGFGSAAYVLVRRAGAEAARGAEGDCLHLIAARVDAWDQPLSVPGPDKAERILRALELASATVPP